MTASLPEKESPADGRRPDIDESEAGWHGHISLRLKGVFSLLAFIAYIGIVGVIIMAERERLFSLVQDLEQVHQQESQLVQVNMLVARAVLSANEQYFAALPDVAARQIVGDLAPLERVVAGLLPIRPQLGNNLLRMQALGSELRLAPSRAGVARVRAELHRLVVDLEGFTKEVRAEKEQLMASYRRTHDKVTLETLALAMLGVIIFGALVTVFFTRLTWDIRRVAARAVAVIKGYRGEPLEVTRGDDVGGLMIAVNEMQRELRVRERRLELARQQQFYQEKMAAVGSLASAIAHEINNPIMAIAGVAESIAENQRQNADCCSCDVRCEPELILEQTRRIAQITRQIAEFTVPMSPEPQVLDLNALVGSTCNFIRFDKRFRRIELHQVLDSQLPAVTAVADHVTQILINLLVNAADALESVDDRPPTVILTTRLDGDFAVVDVADNGAGMDAETAAKAFDEYFTTKGPGKGSGLGLFLCKSLLDANGGNIALESTLGEGTRVVVRLPLAAEA